MQSEKAFSHEYESYQPDRRFPMKLPNDARATTPARVFVIAERTDDVSPE